MINFTGKNLLYIEISDFYRNLMERGILKEGEWLPSIREVALAEGINPATVEKAFTLLVNEGYVTNIPKKGFVVAKKAKGDRLDLLQEDLEGLLAKGYTKEEIIDTLEKMEGKK